MDGTRFPDWFGPWSFEPGSVTDLFGLGVGVLTLIAAAIIAWRQFKVMNTQTEMMREQAAATRRQEAIAVEQSAIAKRQGEIAETQHQIMQEQLARKAVLELSVRAEPRRTHMQRHTTYWLHVANNGNKTCQQLRWFLSVDKAHAKLITMPMDVETRQPDDDEWQHEQYSGLYNEPVFPTRMASVIIFTLENAVDTSPAEIEIEWAVESEDGRNPPDFEHQSFTLRQDTFIAGEDLATLNGLNDDENEEEDVDN